MGIALLPRPALRRGLSCIWSLQGCLSLRRTLALAFLGPSLLVLAWRSYRSGNRPAAVIGLCLPLSGVALFQWLTGLGLLKYLGGKGGGYILPVLAEPGFRESYRLFSISHFLDFFNVLILAAPAACMALFLLKKRDLGRHPFLLASAAFPLLFTFLANPEIGALRDWDLLALLAVPLTLRAASALLARVRGGNVACPPPSSSAARPPCTASRGPA